MSSKRVLFRANAKISKESTMKRPLICAGAALVLSFTSAVAQTEPPAAAQPSPPKAPAEQPAEIAPPEPEAQQPGTPEAATPSPTVQFLNDQKSSDWLATELIGASVVNANNETIGDVNDLVTDQGGKIIGVLLGAGGFLGIGEKDVAVRFEDLKIARDEDNDINIMTNLTKEQLASAPDFRTLDEQTQGTDQTGQR
jgi:sporulation protein YlmC with PRC-barrel domain